HNVGEVPGVKLVTDAAKFVGSASIAPFEALGTALSSMPLGWLPGGADETFNYMGKWMGANDLEGYAAWQVANTKASADTLGGGNIRADFNIEWTEKYADMTQQGASGLGAISPEFMMGRAGIGSVGGAMSHAIQGFLGILSVGTQRQLAGSGLTDPEGGAARGAMKGVRTLPVLGLLAGPQDAPSETPGRTLNRVAESADRLAKGLEVSDVERFAVDKFQSGAWTEDHALNYIVSHGQGFTRDPLGQIILTAATDPLMYATLGAGGVSAIGSAGARVAEAGLQASNLQKIGMAVAAVKAHPLLGPVARIARGLVDPLGVMPKTTATQGLVDLYSGSATAAFNRGYGEFAVQDLFRDAAQHGFTDQLQSDIGAYAMNKAKEFTAVRTQVTQMAKDLGETVVHTNPDDVIEPMLRGAGRDVITDLTDYMLKTAKNTFTPGETYQLAQRIAASYGGGSVDDWVARIAKMSDDTKSAYHAVTYESADKALMGAIGEVTGYGGKLDLGRLVLVNDANLSNVSAEKLLADIGAAVGTAAKTKVWNEASLLYARVADLGRASGRSDLRKLTREVRSMIDDNRLVKVAEADELVDPALRPINDMLARYTVDGTPLWSIGFRPEESVAWGLKRHPVSGNWMVERAPTIAHVVDAVPAAQPFSSTTRNILGQIIGADTARVLNRPIESTEAIIKAFGDQVSGRRLVLNVQRRFEKSVVEELGLPAKTARDLFTAARDVAGLEHTTIRGITGTNLWKAAKDLI
ncbi:MAG: hypothetical protein IMZ62_18870, partial [Chloroflexi bacterium]|nr:hypothetical protein [Chloroflexota bacterium]